MQSTEKVKKKLKRKKDVPPGSPRLAAAAPPRTDKILTADFKARPKVNKDIKKVLEPESDKVEAKCDALNGSVPVKSMTGLSKITRKALEDRGFSTLLEVQHKSFEPIFSGKDTVGRAKTGCGKTLAFCLPVIERIVADGLSDGQHGRKPLMVGLAPTRELAKQILVELNFFTAVHKLKGTCFYGGTAFGPQCEEARAGLDIVIATPGRLLDHLKRGTLSFESVRFVVMDEADEMLSMGFQEDVENILSYIPSSAQKMLFSATMPKWVQTVISKHLTKPVTVDIVGKDNQANANITHQCISCSPFERGDTLADLCKAHAGQFGKTLVFTETKKDCDELAKHPTLIAMGAGVLHGDIPQTSREVTMENFRTGKIRLLLATDVASRGLDVPSVDLVVMTRPPGDLDTYVHRSGRTARAGKTGTCVVFYTRNEEYLIRLLQYKKGIPLKRRGPPQPSEIVVQAAHDSVRQIDQIHQDNVEAFHKVAEELLAERGNAVYLLSAALAAMTGYTARIKCRSLLSSFEGSVSILIESEREIEATSKAWYLLRKHVTEEISQVCRGMQLVKGRYQAIFDCPQDHQATILGAQTWQGIKFTLAKELPELEPHPNAEGTSVADDMRKQADWRARRWEKIRGSKNRDGNSSWGNGDGGVKRSWEDSNGGGRGGGRGGGGGGKGKGDGKGFGGGGRGKGESSGGKGKGEGYGGRGKGGGKGDGGVATGRGFNKAARTE